MTRFFFFFFAKGDGRATSALLLMSSSLSSSFSARNDAVRRAATAAAAYSSSSSSNFSGRSFFSEGGGGKSDVVGATHSPSSSSRLGRTIGENIFRSSSSLRSRVHSSNSVSSRHFSGARQREKEKEEQEEQEQEQPTKEEEEEEDTLHLSEKCEDQLRSIFLKEMEKGGGKEGVLERKSILRIGVDGGGCAGFQYTFALVDEKDVNDASGDRVFRGRKFPEEAKVVCDEVSFAYLKGSTVDYAEEMIRSAFEVVKNPNAEQKCGCGVSFEAKF
jgi:iron-sulfur cluster assembly accessory protein